MVLFGDTSMSKKAFITGITGQDGSYLAEFLVSKGYEVHGLVRQSTQFTPDKWGHLKNLLKNDQLQIHYGDLNDSSGLRTILEEIKPDEIYNLAAQSHVGLSFQQPENTSDVTAMGPLRLLESIRRCNFQCRFYQASSSEQFGKVVETPQCETTRFYPRSPYGCAKVYAHFLTQNYREAYGMFAVSGILFNHESPRRGENFVTRKITRAIGRIVAGTQDKLVLGNTDARRDWGYAPEYVEAMWMMLQNKEPVDYVVGTGQTHTVQDFINEAFNVVDMNPDDFIVQDAKFIRPSEVDTLCANPQKIKDDLGWKPNVSFKSLVKIMVEHDIELALKEKALLE